MAHGDAIGHRNRGELARRSARPIDPALGCLSLARQRDIARRGLVPTGRDADEGLCDLFLCQTHGIVVGPVGRPIGTDGDVAAG
jgi:hypothetical protein